MKRFRKTVNLVVEGIVSGDRVDIAVRPAEDEITITGLCISNGDGESSSCRKIFLYVPPRAVGGITLDNVDAGNSSGISISVDLHIETR